MDFESLKSKVDQAVYSHQKAHERSSQLQTLNGETMKSIEETLIANFLYFHGVSYIYEHPYAYETGDEYHRHYRPDFYLPNEDIYIEHFGINEAGEAPWLSPVEAQKYVVEMEWKRALHQEKGTTLIESYSYYNRQGVLLEKLEENLCAHQVAFHEVDFKTIFSAIYDQENDRYFKEFIKLITNFIGLFKSNGYTEQMFAEFIQQNQRSDLKPFLKQRNQLFFEMVKPIYVYYQNQLKERGAIDFNDMIHQATDAVQSGLIPLSYQYILIDEYQDISKERYQLVKAIRDQTHAKIMCVGDDWQSIYRFAGSDMELFTQFERFFGYHQLLRIERTYRNSQELIDAAGQFVMRNPRQYKKDLISQTHVGSPIRIYGYQNDVVTALKQAIEDIVSHYGDEGEIMLLGRNNFDINLMDRSPQFQKHEDRRTERLRIIYKPYPKLILYFLTVHRSKGLESDQVILLNAADRLLGFPNRMADDPMLAWVLTNADDFSFAEERRLFYVALTRTKNRIYILTPDQTRSPFVKELIEVQQIPYQPMAKMDSIDQNPPCPKCQTGHLVLRKSGQRSFLGCSNYPVCDRTYNQVEILENPLRCPSCGGYMVKRSESFYGCTNYPVCKEKMAVK